MTRKLLVLSCATLALAGGAALAQDVYTQPPLNQPDVETAAQNANAASEAASPGGPSVASEAPSGDLRASDEAAAAQTPAAQNSSADVSTDGAWTTQSQAAAASPSNPPADTAVNPPLSDNTSIAETTTTSADVAQTPAPQPASASVSSMAYATNIANAPGGVFKAKVGNYPMSHYAPPSRPLPYDQVDAYLRASKQQQLARNWWSGTELASTATSSDVSASVPAASDVSDTSSAARTSAAASATAAGTPGLRGDTDVSLNSDTSPVDSTTVNPPSSSATPGLTTPTDRASTAP